MSNKNNIPQITDLFIKFLDNRCSPEEIKDLLTHFDSEKDEDVLRTLINVELGFKNNGVQPDSESNKRISRVRNALITQIDKSSLKIEGIEDDRFKNMSRPEKSNFTGLGFKLLAAVTLMGIGLTLVLRLTLPQLTHTSSPVVRDIAPGISTATLTLSNGQKINLNNTANGQIASQSGTRILKTANGQITYQASNPNKAIYDTVSNMISVPRGGQWQVDLPDGSKVWLNSASTLTYPVTFAHQKNRIVKLSGEGYFEVAKDKMHPFLVKTSQQEVQVYGTHFNINSYPDESFVNTTLAEGSVKVSMTGGHPRFLVPGQQAILKGRILTVSEANVEETLAWKNGYFRFNDENIRSIMRKLSRWYNVDVQYGPDITNDGLNGKISRFKNISQVLRALEATKSVHFKVEGRRVTVMK
jgi:transmembrane sensor